MTERYGSFVERGVKNDHDFVWTHGNLTTSSGLCGHGRSVAGGSPASATVPGYRMAGPWPPGNPGGATSVMFPWLLPELVGVIVGPGNRRRVGLGERAGVKRRLRVVFDEQLSGLRGLTIDEQLNQPQGHVDPAGHPRSSVDPLG